MSLDGNVNRPNDNNVCLGLTENIWKKRYYNQTKYFRNEKFKTNTVLHLEIKERNR